MIEVNNGLVRDIVRFGRRSRRRKALVMG